MTTGFQLNDWQFVGVSRSLLTAYLTWYLQVDTMFVNTLDVLDEAIHMAFKHPTRLLIWQNCGWYLVEMANPILSDLHN